MSPPVPRLLPPQQEQASSHQVLRVPARAAAIQFWYLLRQVRLLRWSLAAALPVMAYLLVQRLEPAPLRPAELYQLAQWSLASPLQPQLPGRHEQAWLQ